MQNFCTFKFITPYSPSNSSFPDNINTGAPLTREGYLRSKIYLRASALIFHYFEHIRFLFKAWPDSTLKANRLIHCYIKRETSHIITLTKAPMAHKKFSREQYYFKYYVFIFRYKNVFHFTDKNASSIDVIFVNSFLSRLLRCMGTNLFFLQSCRTFYHYTSNILP